MTQQMALTEAPDQRNAAAQAERVGNVWAEKQADAPPRQRHSSGLVRGYDGELVELSRLPNRPGGQQHANLYGCSSSWMEVESIRRWVLARRRDASDGIRGRSLRLRRTALRATGGTAMNPGNAKLTHGGKGENV